MGGKEMIDGHSILTFLNAREEFWFWGVHHIQVNDKEKALSFYSMREGNSTKFHISLGEGGFKLKLYKALNNEKMKVYKIFDKVMPGDLSDVISHWVYHEIAA
jgi:hypothetical protein